MQSEIKISQDERERAVLRSRRMYQTDLQSDLATAEDRGIQKGFQIGFQEAFQEGKLRMALSAARLMMADGEPDYKIMRYTGLSHDYIQKLTI